MNDVPSKIILNDLIMKFSRLISQETINLIRNYGVVYGEKFAKDVFNELIALFIESLVLHGLKQGAKAKTKVEAYNKTVMSFNITKVTIQESVAKGFAQAFSKFNGQFVDYYCEIKPIGPAKNKKPC